MSRIQQFISARLRFREKIAVTAIAISFFIIIVAVAVSSGFRKEIRESLSELTGDIILTESSFDVCSDSDPVRLSDDLENLLMRTEGVESIAGSISRAGIVRGNGSIQGIVVKGVESCDSSLQVRIPAALADKIGLEPGDNMLTYFIGEKVKMRKFTVREIYDCPVETDNGLVVYAPIGDLRRINGWQDDEVSAIEIHVSRKYRSRERLEDKAAEIGFRSGMISVASTKKYARLFDWLELIEFNTDAILLLMTIVAGFNMISGLLILLFRSISTIGTLKALGMTDRAVSGVFLRVSARAVLVGMAIGNALALIFCLVQDKTHLIKLNPVNYFVSFVPVDVEITSVLLADAAAFAGIMVLMLIPCMFISKIDPSELSATR